MLRRFDETYPTLSPTLKLAEKNSSNKTDSEDNYPDEDSTSPKPVLKPIELYNSVLGLQVLQARAKLDNLSLVTAQQLQISSVYLTTASKWLHPSGIMT